MPKRPPRQKRRKASDWSMKMALKGLSSFYIVYAVDKSPATIKKGLTKINYIENLYCVRTAEVALVTVHV